MNIARVYPCPEGLCIEWGVERGRPGALVDQPSTRVLLSRQDLALLLGYSEQSAFTRAFRQWTGQAPRQWRQQQQRQP